MPSATPVIGRLHVLPPRSGQAGFTLLELLIALVLTVLVATMLFSGLHTAINSWESGSQKIEEVSRHQVVDGLVRRLLRQSRTLMGAGDGVSESQLLFNGEKESLKVVAPMLKHLGVGGLYVITLKTARQDGEKVFKIHWEPYRPRKTEINEEAQDERVLVSDIENAEFAYYGSTQPGDDPSWESAWDDSRKLPLLVRLRLNSASKTWPDIIVRIPQFR